jgi:hypothetical protein
VVACSKDRAVADTVLNAPELPDSVPDAERLNRRCELLKGVYEGLASEGSAFGEKEHGLRDAMGDLRRRRNNHEAEVNRWKHSGVFGGEPWMSQLIGWDFKGDKLKNEAQQLASEDANLARAFENLGADHKMYLARLKRSDKEAMKFSRRR